MTGWNDDPLADALWQFRADEMHKNYDLYGEYYRQERLRYRPAAVAEMFPNQSALWSLFYDIVPSRAKFSASAVRCLRNVRNPARFIRAEMLSALVHWDVKPHQVKLSPTSFYQFSSSANFYSDLITTEVHVITLNTNDGEFEFVLEFS